MHSICTSVNPDAGAFSQKWRNAFLVSMQFSKSLLEDSKINKWSNFYCFCLRPKAKYLGITWVVVVLELLFNLCYISTLYSHHLATPSFSSSLTSPSHPLSLLPPPLSLLPPPLSLLPPSFSMFGSLKCATLFVAYFHYFLHLKNCVYLQN